MCRNIRTLFNFEPPATEDEMQAAALQFPFGHPAVATVIPGARSVAEVEGNVVFIEHAIPADFWAELKQEGLIDAEAPAP